MTEVQNSNFQDAFNAGQTTLQEANGLPFTVVPAGARVESFVGRVAAPFFVDQKVELGTAEAFVEYVNRFADKDSIVFVNVLGGIVKGVLDYHKAEIFEQDGSKATPRHGKHIAVLNCRLTSDFEKIRANSGKQLKQEEFALFLEDILPCISQPDAATLLEIVSTLQSTSKVDFKSGIRTDNGQVSLTYNETIEAKAGQSGSITIPQSIVFGVQIHRGGNAYALPARFRYRITGASLMLWYDLDQIDTAIETSMNDVVDHIKNGKTILHDEHGTEIGTLPGVVTLVIEGSV